MVAVPLIHAQFVPPRIKNYIRRTSLTDLGLNILSHRITTVTAPAGYGKSIWVSSLLEEPGWPPTPWLILDRHDSEPSFLLYHLIHAIKNVLPEFGSQSLRTMNSLDDTGQDWLIAVSTLLAEIPAETEFVLVLDDFHLIDQNPTVCNIIEHLIRWLPARTHLVLISRKKPAINLYREQLSGELLEIESDRLVFSSTEAQELLLLLNLNLSIEEIDLIHSITEGWAVGLRMLSMYLKQSGESVKKTLAAFSHKDADLYTYFSNELLQYLSEELRNFLLDSSLLPFLEPELCDAALERRDSDINIKNLHAQGFLSKIKGETITWRLHHLTSEFLGDKAMELRTPDYVISLRKRASAFFAQKGDIDRALEQVTTCEDWPAAVNLLQTHGDKNFLQKGRLDTLKSWIERLPEEVVQTNPWLLYFKGMSILHIYQEEALENLSHAADLAGKKGDIKCQISSLFAMMGVYTFANNAKKIKETAKRIPIAAALLKDSWSRGMILVAALGQAAWDDNLRQGHWLSWLVNKSNLDPLTRTTYLAFSSIIQFRLGNLIAAEELLEKLLVDPYLQENERWIGEAYSIYTVLCELNGNHDKLREISQELLRLGDKYRAQHQLGFAHRSLAYLHLISEDLDKAREEYRLSRNTFMEGNNIFHAYLTDLDLILLRISVGENAKDLLEETQYLIEKLKTLTGGRGLDEYALCVAGIITMEAGHLDLARQRFEVVSNRCKKKGSRQFRAGTQLLLARLSLLQGDNDTADNYLLAAMGVAESEGWEYFGYWHPETIYSLCRRALLQGIHSQWATHLLSRWFPKRTCEEACNLLVYPDKHVQNCASVLIKDFVQKTGLPVIHLNCLGEFHLFVNGVEIPPNRWKTKKTENLVKFLLTNRQQHLKEKIIEEFWPGANPKLGDASLRMALTHVRQTLEIDVHQDEIVILRRGIIYLNPKIKVFTDYGLFSSFAHKALKNTDSDNSVQIELFDQAVGLYQGDFLPDNLYDDWTANLRNQLRESYLQLHLKLIEYYLEQGKLPQAIHACHNYLSLEPADESVTRKTMKLLWQSGQKQLALSLYLQFSAILANDYNITPTLETSSLYEKIRSS